MQWIDSLSTSLFSTNFAKVRKVSHEYEMKLSYKKLHSNLQNVWRKNRSDNNKALVAVPDPNALFPLPYLFKLNFQLVKFHALASIIKTRHFQQTESIQSISERR